MNADELLEKAKGIFFHSEAAYRDQLLECGLLLHEFVIEWLREGDGKGNRTRRLAGTTRKEAVRVAAEAFGKDRSYISKLIAASMAWRLLGDGIALNDLGWCSIFHFRPLLRRRFRGMDAEASIPISESEEWEIRPGFEEKGPALLAQAAASGWTQLECQRAVQDLLDVGGRTIRSARAKSSASNKAEESAIDILETAASKASPGDVAEMCLSLIEKARDPAAVALRLRVMLQKYLPQKQRA